MAGGGREVLVPPDRLQRWRDNFVARHGPADVVALPDGPVLLRAADGATAVARAPSAGPRPGTAAAADLADPWAALAADASAPRVLAVLLVRLGGHVVAVTRGEEVLRSRTRARQVHGRTRKGGSSSGRFARRREGQARRSLDAAAQAAVDVLLGEAADALVTGGDRGAVDTVLGDLRLAPLAALPRLPWVHVPEPRARVLPDALAAALAVRVVVREPLPGGCRRGAVASPS